MKNLKFRAWDGNSMVYSQDENRKTQSMMSAGDILNSYDEHVMQFIGLQDKNKQDIYEGDIYEMGTGRKYVVSFHEGAFVSFSSKKQAYQGAPIGWDDHKPDLFTDQITVIGNIYENPELL